MERCGPSVRIRGWGSPDWVFLAWRTGDGWTFEIDFDWPADNDLDRLIAGETFSEARIIDRKGESREVARRLLPQVRIRATELLPEWGWRIARAVDQWQNAEDKRVSALNVEIEEVTADDEGLDAEELGRRLNSISPLDPRDETYGGEQ